MNPNKIKIISELPAEFNVNKHASEQEKRIVDQIETLFEESEENNPNNYKTIADEENNGAHVDKWSELSKADTLEINSSY